MLEFDNAKPDGTPRKLLDVSKLTKQGWQAKIPLREGIESMYEWFLKNRKV
jgi:GDP-L-fucose synthase